MTRAAHPVKRAAAMMDATIAALRTHQDLVHAPPTPASRRHERIDSAAPDIQAMKPHLTLEMLDKLAKLDQEK